MMLDRDSTNENQDGEFTTLWKLKIPSKGLFFAWRLIREGLPTKSNLRIKNMEINNVQ